MSDVETCTVITFKTICDAHSELLSAQADEQLSTPKVTEFLNLAAGAGTQIESIAERDSVRSMMNYWSAILSRQRTVEPEVDEGQPPAAVPAPGGQRPTLAAFDPGQAPDLREADRPFVGLSAFEPEQADLFYGRDEAIAQLLDLVKSSGAVLVSGASGTGKSSLVRAGLIPRLRTSEGGSDWLVLSALPGFDPLGNILAALAPEGATAAWRESVRESIEDDPAGILQLAEERRAGRPLLLLVDQFEEIFSLSPPADRDKAGLALAALAEAPEIHLVLTIREEYVERERSERTLKGLDFATIVEFRVPPMTADELREAVTAPAARAGLVFQDGVVERIIADVAAEPAALPLLQFALLQLWRRREGNRVTLKTYEDVGGPTAALSRAAEKAYETLRSPEAQANAQLIFQQLVKPSLIYDAVRDRVTRQQLESLLPGASVRTVLDPFIAAALIRVTPGAERGEDRIEIAHEALIRNWDRLRRWSLKLRDREEQYLSLVAKAEDWQRSGRAPGHLLFGKALRDAEQVHSKHGPGRGDPDQARLVGAFLEASRLQTRRFKQGLAFAAVLTPMILGLALWLQISKGDLKTSLDKLVWKEDFFSQGVRAQFNSDAPRQFVQMLLSRGTLTTADLPAEYTGMRPEAAGWGLAGGDPPFSTDFLGKPNESFFPEPPGASRLIRLPNLLLWVDSRSGAPLMAISQSLRQPGSIGGIAPSDQLLRYNGVQDLLNEREVAMRGLGIAHLVDWREVGWGNNAGVAAESTNLLSTMFPSPLRGSGYGALSSWSMMNTWLLLRHNPKAEKVIYISGIVPKGPQDRNEPPRNLWKVAVSIGEDDAFVVDAAMLPASGDSEDGLPGRTDFQTIAKRSGIDFSKLLGLTAVRTAEKEELAPAVPAQTGGARVYIQTNEVDPDVLQALQRTLKTAQFAVPPSEEVAACVSSPILRYYSPEDRQVAQQAAKLVSSPLRAAGYLGGDLQARRFATKSKARPGHLELWVCGNIGP
jgi:hypothetical protein